jgi:hypothetical protein
MVIPSLNLVAVRMGWMLEKTDSHREVWQTIAKLLAIPLVEAITHQSPYPPSDVIDRVEFAPESEIKIDGEDSDNWPITWAEDGEQYTSYGDGYGFVPHTDKNPL